MLVTPVSGSLDIPPPAALLAGAGLLDSEATCCPPHVTITTSSVFYDLGLTQCPKDAAGQDSGLLNPEGSSDVQRLSECTGLGEEGPGCPLTSRASSTVVTLGGSLLSRDTQWYTWGLRDCTGGPRAVAILLLLLCPVCNS